MSGFCPPLVLLVPSIVPVLSFGRAGQPCVLFLSFWCPLLVSSWFLSLVFFVTFSCPPGVILSSWGLGLAVVLLLSRSGPTFSWFFSLVFFLSSWQLFCCCPLAALARPVSSFCPPGFLLLSWCPLLVRLVPSLVLVVLPLVLLVSSSCPPHFLLSFSCLPGVLFHSLPLGFSDEKTLATLSGHARSTLRLVLSCCPLLVQPCAPLLSSSSCCSVAALANSASSLRCRLFVLLVHVVGPFATALSGPSAAWPLFLYPPPCPDIYTI